MRPHNCIVHYRFNTSYVSVQAKGLQNERVCFEFQYILCVGSSRADANITYANQLVSIHPMCRFKPPRNSHQVFFFRFQYILCVGSSLAFFWSLAEALGFQYILCVGSRCFSRCDSLGGIVFQYILCVGSRDEFNNALNA